MTQRLSIGFLALMILVTIPNAFATTYYVAANGSDSNGGTSKTAPWAHAPGMPNCVQSCAATTPKPGDQFIFRGGDTWHFGNSGASPYAGSNWNFSWNGTSGSPIYIGVDLTWYSGSSFTRPILTGDNPQWNGTSFPSSCAYDFGSRLNGLVLLGSYNTFDNFEIAGVCWSGNLSGQNPGMVNPGSYDLVSNIYCHGWSEVSTAIDNFNCFAYNGTGTHITFDHNVMSGDDTPHWPAGNVNCQYNNAAPCATGSGIYDRAYEIKNNVFHLMHLMAVTIDTYTSHDNLFEYLESPPTSAMLNAQHEDALMVYAGGSSQSGVTELFYNNVARHTYANQSFYIPVSAGMTSYVFNNVFYDIDWNGSYGVPSNCLQFNAQSSGTQTLYFYNNTMLMDATGGGCQLGMWGNSGGNAFGIPWNGPIHAANNHLIGFSTLSSVALSRSSGASYNLVDDGGNLVQTLATASTQGYVSTTSPVGYAPVSSSGTTVGTGINMSNLCATFSVDSDLCSGTSGAVQYANGAGGKIALSPAVTIVPRGTTWDVGAFQFKDATAGPNAPTNLSATVQ